MLYARTRMGGIHLMQGDLQSAVCEFEVVLEASKELRKDAPDDVLFIWDMAVAYYQLGAFKMQLGGYEEARRDFNRAITLYEQVKQHSDNFDRKAELDLIRCQLGLASVDRGQHRFQSAVDRAAALGRRVDAYLEQHPDDVAAHLIRWGGLDMRAQIHASRNELDQAIPLIRECVALPPALAADPSAVELVRDRIQPTVRIALDAAATPEQQQLLNGILKQLSQ